MTDSHAWLIVATNLVSGAVGYASCYFGVVKIGTAVMRTRRPSDRKQAEMPNRPGVRASFVLVVVLMAMTLTTVLMYALDQRQNAQREQERAAYSACITEWGDGLVETITRRTDARKAYDDAVGVRGDATAQVLRVALRLVSGDPRGTVERLERALEAARSADVNLQAAADTLAKTQQANEYEAPTLACGTDPNEDDQGD